MQRANLQYCGVVTIKLKNKTIKGRNKGTNALFNNLCMIMSRTFVADSTALYNALPSYITFVSSTYEPSITKTSYNDITSNMKLLISELPIYKSEADTTDNRTIYSSILNYNNILDVESFKKSIYALLLDGNKENILAYYPINGAEIYTDTATTSSQAEVEWQLSFENKDSSNSESEAK